MILCLVPLLILCLYKIKIHKQMVPDYLGKAKTGAIKGVFVVTVFLVHVVQYLSLADALPDKLFDFGMGILGQNIVIPFLLYSGYGIGCAYLSQGRSYISRLPKYRILTTWIHFALAILMFWVVDLFVIHADYHVTDYILSLFAWTSVGNSTWFVFAILICWACTVISFSIFPNKYHALGCVVALLCVYIGVISWIKNSHEWYDTILCYPLGLLVAFEKEKLDKFLCNGYRTVVSMLLLCIAWVSMRVFIEKNIVLYEVQSLLFGLFLLTLTSRVSIYNPLLVWLGKHSFSIYILQRIPMMLLGYYGISQWNRWVFILGSALLTLILAWCFDLLTGALDRRIRKEPKNIS